MNGFKNKPGKNKDLIPSVTNKGALRMPIKQQELPLPTKEEKIKEVKSIIPALKDDNGAPITKEIEKEEKAIIPTNQSQSTLTEAQKLETQVSLFEYLNGVIFGVLDEEKCTKLNNYFIQGKTTHLVHKNKIGMFGVKISDTGLPGCPTTITAPAFVKLYVPKIPEKIYRQIIGFFKEIMKEHSNSEAFLQVYWDNEEKEYVVHVPEQKVSGTRVSYDATKNLDKADPDKYTFVFECHSHNNMDAFFSGVDDADEKETRIYGVFGQLGKANHAEKFRIVVNGKYILIKANQIFDLAKPEEADFPKEWLEKVTSGGSYMSGFPTMRGGHGYNDNYNYRSPYHNEYTGHGRRHMTEDDFHNRRGGDARQHPGFFDKEDNYQGYPDGYVDEDGFVDPEGYVDEDGFVDPEGAMAEIEELTEDLIDKTDGFTDLHSSFAFYNMLEQYGAVSNVKELLENGGQVAGV